MNREELVLYLERIGITAGALDWMLLDSRTLGILQRAHRASVPFENLAIVQDSLSPALDEASLFDTIVRRHRGGISHELNALFAQMLRAFGYDVELKAGQLANHDNHWDVPFLIASAPANLGRDQAVDAGLDTPWFVDVGFGTSLENPLRLIVGHTQDDGRNRYRFEKTSGDEGERLRLMCIPGLEGSATPFEMLAFGPHACDLDDYREQCDWLTTAEESPIAREPLITLQDATGTRTLTARHYSENGRILKTFDEACPQAFNRLLYEKFDLPFNRPETDYETEPSMNNDSTRILFVCHGNICRSTMAQCVMQHLVDQAGLSDRFTIDSAATTNEEIGNPIYPPAREKLLAEGVPIIPHRARRILAGEQAGWDYLICMDNENIRHLRRILGPENMGKVTMLMSYVGEEREVADPWYTRNFDATYDDVLAGCTALLDKVRSA